MSSLAMCPTGYMKMSTKEAQLCVLPTSGLLSKRGGDDVIAHGATLASQDKESDGQARRGESPCEKICRPSE